MSCGCPDQESDAQIIAEYNRRKEEIPVQEFIHIVYTMETNIRDFIFQFDESEIESIVRQEPGWAVSVKKPQT